MIFMNSNHTECINFATPLYKVIASGRVRHSQTEFKFPKGFTVKRFM